MERKQRASITRQDSDRMSQERKAAAEQAALREIARMESEKRIAAESEAKETAESLQAVGMGALLKVSLFEAERLEGSVESPQGLQTDTVEMVSPVEDVLHLPPEEEEQVELPSEYMEAEQPEADPIMPVEHISGVGALSNFTSLVAKVQAVNPLRFIYIGSTIGLASVALAILIAQPRKLK